MFTFSEKHITDYHTTGCTIFREILPPSLITDLRRVADRARDVAREQKGSQTQRLQPVGSFDLDLQPIRDYGELSVLNDAIQRLLTPQHIHADPSRLGILLEPADHPWCTNWHRDWRDHMPVEVFEREFREDWDKQIFNINYMNQINCALYEDPATWFVPGSHYRQANTPGEEAARDAYDPGLHRDAPTVSNEQRERDCLNYVRGMPGAFQLRLNPGDFALYRPSAWHIGNYVPYRKRATLHDFCGTPEYAAYIDERSERRKAAMARYEQRASLDRTQ